MGERTAARVSAYHNETQIKKLEDSALNKQDEDECKSLVIFDEIDICQMKILIQSKYLTSCSSVPRGGLFPNEIIPAKIKSRDTQRYCLSREQIAKFPS